MDKKLLKGTFIITFGIIFSRFLGIFFTFPFSNMVKSEGLSLYSYAYIPYAIFIDLATLGIPLGVAKVVSGYLAENKYRTVKKVLFLSMMIMIVVSLVAFLSLNLLSGVYAKMVLSGQTVNQYENVKRVINLVSLALLVVPFVSVLRGYFQGHNQMVPIALSQIIEQFVRVFFSILMAYIVIYRLKQSYVKAIDYAVFAAFLSGVMALVVLLVFFFKQKKSTSDEEISSKQLVKQIIIFAVPFLIVGLNITLFNLADSLFFNRALNNVESEKIYGIYSFEISKLINIPVALAIALAINLLPNITKEKVKENNENVRKYIVSGYQLIFTITIPIFFLTFFYADNIYAVFFSNYEYGESVLRFSSILIILYSLGMVLNAVMQGVNKGKQLVFSVLAGITMKYLFNYIYLDRLGYQGAILLTSFSFLLMITCNLYFLREEIDLKEFMKKFFRSVGLAVIPLLFILLLRNYHHYQGFDRLTNFGYLFLYFGVYFIIYLFIIGALNHKLVVGDESGGI